MPDHNNHANHHPHTPHRAADQRRAAPLSLALTLALAWTIAPATLPRASAQPLLPAADIQPPATPLASTRIVGEGSVELIMIPGLSCDGSVFDDFIRTQQADLRFHLLTLPGMSGSQPPDGLDRINFHGTPWLDNAVQAIAHYIDSNRLKDPVLIGHALGGSIAFRIALDHPELIAAAITLDGFPAMPLHNELPPEQRRQFIMGNIASQLYARSEDEWFRSTDMMATMFTVNEVRNSELAAMFRRTAHPIARRYMLEFYTTDRREELPNCTVPILAIASIERETAALADHRSGAEGMRQRWRDAISPLPNGSLVFAEDCRHFVFDDCPELVDDAIRTFLRKHNILLEPAPTQPADPE